MAAYKPPLEDLPMSLGDHLHELRRRLIIPLISIGILFLAAFAIEKQLKLLVAQPMSWAIDIFPEMSEQVGLKKPVKFGALDVLESALVSMSVSFYAAIFVAFPILVYQLWMFVGVGLLPKERRLAFLFIPAGIMFFYAGTIIGYFYGLPYYYAWMIKWTANDPTAVFMLTLKTYHKNFVLMTIIFGVIADIPWLVMVLVRVGLVTVDQLAKHRKVAIMVNTVIAAFITPPDGISMLIMMLPLFLLFELGLIFSRVMMWHHGRMESKEQQAAAEAAAAAEKSARDLAPQPQDAPGTETTDLAPATNTTTDTSDGPVSRDHLTENSSGENVQDDHNNNQHDHDQLPAHSDAPERDAYDHSDVDADAHRDEYHHEPEKIEPPKPRGMDEAGMFAEEDYKKQLGDHDINDPHGDDPRD